MKRKVLVFLLVIAVISCLVVLSSCSALTGLSAYEIAVQNGFSGTQAEWLASLKGSDGSNGADGVDGDNGTDGVDGAYAGIGASAYEIAVSNGFVGTETEWIASLKGSDATGISIANATSKAIVSAVSVISSFQYNYTTRNMLTGTISTTREWGGSAGAGVIFSDVDTNADGFNDAAYIITNYHVVYDENAEADNNICEYIWVYLYGSRYPSSWTNAVRRVEGYDAGDKLVAQYVGGSYNNDIAVLKLTGEAYSAYAASAATPATIADSREVLAGDTAIAIGNPEGYGLSATAGIVSVDSEYISVGITSTASTLRVMRIDTAVNSGNSGGGLFDANGNLIGIVNAKTNSTSIENISYAIPTANATAVAGSIIANESSATVNEKATKLLLGVTVQLTSSSARRIEETTYKVVSDDGITYRTEAVTTYRTVIVNTITVSEVNAAAPAGTLGLEVGDVLQSVWIGGIEYPIERLFTLGDALYNVRVGNQVYATVSRGGSTQNLQLHIITADMLSVVE